MREGKTKNVAGSHLNVLVIEERNRNASRHHKGVIMQIGMRALDQAKV